MKKYLTIIAITAVMILCLSSCGKSDYAREQEAKRESIYESGYEDGYDDGYEAGSERGYDTGYDDGYSEGYDDSKTEFALNVIEKAESYARDKADYSVYEAWNNIMIYRDRPDGYDIPSEEEYRQCVDTLVYFCEYLDNSEFFN